jgi:WD40 repeat protein
VSDENLAAFAQDTSRFVVRFDIPILASTPHIYVSALPFSPPQCFIARQYQSQFSNIISVLSGGDQNWPPLLNIFRGHTHAVLSVDFSPDGKRVVSGSYDHTIRIWDARTGELVAGPFIGHTNHVRSVAFSANGKHVISGSFDRTIRIWDAGTGELVAGPFEGHTKAVSSVAFAPDGKCVVSGSFDCTIRIWDAGTGELVARPVECLTAVSSVSFSPDGKFVVSSSLYPTIRIWDARTGVLVAGPFGDHTRAVYCVSFSPDGKRVVSGSADRTVRIWDAKTGELVAGPFEGHTSVVSSVAFSLDGKRVVSGSADETVRIWDAGTGELVAGPFKSQTKAVYCVSFSPDGKRVVSGSADHTVRIWDAKTGELVTGPFQDNGDRVLSVAGTDQTAAGSDTGITPVSLVAFSQNSENAVLNPRNIPARGWDIEMGQVIPRPFAGHKEAFLSATVTSEATLHIKDAGRGVFNTRSGFLERHTIYDGWVRCSLLMNSKVKGRGLLFWVPETCREAVCGPETLAVIGKHTTRLDLSRFATGTLWTQCRGPPAYVSDCTIGLRIR